MKIGITIGDPAGIGPEIILKALPLFSRDKLYIFANKNILKRTASDLGLTKNFKKIKCMIVDCVRDCDFYYGKPNKKTGQVAMESIDQALKANLDIIITTPIVKEVIKLSHPDFIGHTEYLAQYYQTRKYAMVGLWRDKRIMLMTTHLPLRMIFKKLTAYAVFQKIQLLHWGLKKYFNKVKGSIGVCGLNPHPFEFSLGEDEIIKAGVEKARKKGIDAQGPFSADSIYNRNFDAYLAIYHDQAMIFLKSKKDGLNFTLGLPIIRISPLYGAALDIAGKNLAQTSGLITAIKQGIKIYKNVRRFQRDEH
ncbi:hypothetical protein BXT86_03150 [candidate division WOR-3 bacterium 4484_100]|uniref:4-hydroxythreonine-4-phosphate dehydrogenase PdxA n=1 Tax=candidate division WOR-3 bacterium 4484_100 TaxID=1936077 RepID=A0A1V4QFF0_UNCW3|nr:MAG: hypothetical protein BXT86_03150 [candidate division WOR-3 bacterium 4484_100]